MFKIPKFRIYGEGSKEIQDKISPTLNLRDWDELSVQEKVIAYKFFWNDQFQWVAKATIQYLNTEYLSINPGTNLLDAKYSRRDELEAASTDFQRIFLNEKQELVFAMLAKFVDWFIDHEALNKLGQKELNEDEFHRRVNQAFEVSDIHIKSLNHIFEKFAVNQVFSREGLFPRQDQKIIEEIYRPTLKVLSDPKWKTVNTHLVKMFNDYRDKKYDDIASEAYNSVYAFLKVVKKIDGGNSKGEFGALFKEVSNSIDQTESVKRFLSNISSFISDSRANQGSAKPTVENQISLSPSESLLIMNEVMVLLQYCLTSNFSNKN